MAKALIIKGADFSAVAVDHIVTEPQEYNELAYVGNNWTGESRVEGAYGLYWTSQYQEIDVITNGQAVNANLENGTIVKYRGVYFTTQSNKYLIPYYGIKSVETIWSSGGYKVTEGDLTSVSDSDFRRCSFEAHAGETYHFLLYGAVGLNEVIKGVGDVYTSLADIGGGWGQYIKLTIEEDCTLYVSHYNLGGKFATPLVGKER